MKIKKVFNNNVAAVENENGQEYVVIGKGIAYGKKAGELVNITNAVKIFKPASKGMVKKLSNLVESIPLEHVKVCNEIVNVARYELGQVDDKIFLTLIEHISFAIDRHNKKMEFADTLWEIQRLYPKEYRVGLKALDIIDKRLGVRLPANEATFIAFHFLNANGTNMKTARDSIALIEGIVNIVRKHFDFYIDEDTTYFTRFMAHLRFFASRVIDSSSRKPKTVKENKLLLRLLNEMSTEKACVDEIADYVKAEYGYTVSPNEKSYLIIHIHSIMNEENENEYK